MTEASINQVNVSGIIKSVRVLSQTEKKATLYFVLDCINRRWDVNERQYVDKPFVFEVKGDVSLKGIPYFKEGTTILAMGSLVGKKDNSGVALLANDMRIMRFAKDETPAQPAPATTKATKAPKATEEDPLQLSDNDIPF